MDSKMSANFGLLLMISDNWTRPNLAKNTLPLCQIYFQTIYRHLFPFCGQKDGKLMPAKLSSQKGVKIKDIVIFFSQVWKGFSIVKKEVGYH